MNDVLLLFITYLREYGFWIISGAIILQCNGIPVGANIMVVATGAFSYAGEIDLVVLGLVVFISLLIGDLSSYCLWKWLGGWIWDKFPRFHGIMNSNLEKAKDSFHKYGFLTVIFTRFPFSALGPAINIVAGSTSFTLFPFILAVAAGELIWAVFYLRLGYWLGDSWEQASLVLSQFGIWLLLVLVLILVLYLFLHYIKKTSP